MILNFDIFVFGIESYWWVLPFYGTVLNMESVHKVCRHSRVTTRFCFLLFLIRRSVKIWLLTISKSVSHVCAWFSLFPIIVERHLCLVFGDSGGENMVEIYNCGLDMSSIILSNVGILPHACIVLHLWLSWKLNVFNFEEYFYIGIWSLEVWRKSIVDFLKALLLGKSCNSEVPRILEFYFKTPFVLYL